MTNERESREMARVGICTTASSSSSVCNAHIATTNCNNKHPQQQFVYKDESVCLADVPPPAQPLHIAAATTVIPALFLDSNNHEDHLHLQHKLSASPFSKFFQKVSGTSNIINGVGEQGKRKSSINALIESSCATLGLANGLVPPQRKASSSSTHLSSYRATSAFPPSTSHLLSVDGGDAITVARRRSKSSSGAAMFGSGNISSSTMKPKPDGIIAYTTSTVTTSSTTAGNGNNDAQAPPERTHKSRADSIIEALVTRRLKQERRRSVAALLDSRGSPTRKIADFHHQTHHQHQPQHHQHRANILPSSPTSSPSQKNEITPLTTVQQEQQVGKNYMRSSISHDPTAASSRLTSPPKLNGILPKKSARGISSGDASILRDAKARNSPTFSSMSSSSDEETDCITKQNNSETGRSSNPDSSTRRNKNVTQHTSKRNNNNGDRGEKVEYGITAGTSKACSSSISALLTSSTAIATSPLRAVEDLDTTLHDSDRVIRRLSNEAQREFGAAMEQLRVGIFSQQQTGNANSSAPKNTAGGLSNDEQLTYNRF